MKKKNICIFEDRDSKWFGPLTYTRPVWELLTGAYTFLQRLQQQFPEHEFIYKCRSNLRAAYSESSGLKTLDSLEYSEDLLFINGRCIFDLEDIQQLQNESGDCLFLAENEVAAIQVGKNSSNRILWNDKGLLEPDSLTQLPVKQVNAKLHRFPWELINNSGNQIKSDLDIVNETNPGTQVCVPNYIIVNNLTNLTSTGKVIINPGAIVNSYINIIRFGSNVRLGSGAILDSTNGPIWIDDDADIQPGAIIEGPVYIGKKSIIRPGAKISDGVCLGPQCRIGGEVSNTIMIGYSNKQHSGYLGSSYVGEWVNLGAATDNSDLKNNYRPVDVIIEGEKIDTGDLHVGAMISDHCKTAIHTRLNTGTLSGVCCNLFGADFPAKYIPSFTWFGSDGYVEYKIEKALETIAAVMERRNRRLTPVMRGLLKGIFDSTANERNALLNE